MLALLVGVALFSVYVAAQRARIKSYDGTIMVRLATRLLTEHTLTIDPATDRLHLQSPYTSYGFGTTVLSLPFVAVQRAVNPAGQSLTTLANPLVLAATGSVVFLIGRRLGWTPAVCVVTALGFGLLTPALWQSTEMFSEPGVALAALLLVLGILLCAQEAPGGPLLIGVGASMSVLFRPDSLLLIVPLVLAVPFLASRRSLLSPRAAAAIGVPLVSVGIFQLWYNHHRFGSMFDTGIDQQGRGRGFATPIGEGLDLLLRSPGRGFFWTAPILLIALPGFVLLYRRNAPLTLAIAGVVVGRLLFFARWWTPGGGVAWGPRLLFPVTALLAIPAGEVLQYITEWRSKSWRKVAWGGVAVVACASAVVSVLSVLVGYEQYWNERTAAVSGPARAARVHAYYWSLAHNPIAGNLHLIRTGEPLAPIHFRGGPDVVGLIALAVAAIAVAIALVRARDHDTTSTVESGLAPHPARPSVSTSLEMANTSDMTH